MVAHTDINGCYSEPGETVDLLDKPCCLNRLAGMGTAISP
jgi:hypothetical protein